MRVEVKPELLRWALARAGIGIDVLAERFPSLNQWESGEQRPTLPQLEEFAKATRTPVGYFFLSAPPVEQLPIPDFRTAGNQRIGKPSADLLETIYICQQRQEWFREFMQVSGESRIAFVGSLRIGTDVVAAANSMRDALGFNLEDRRKCPTWVEALRRFIQIAEAAGVLVMVNSVVGNSTQRSLDPSEFRGFALVDDLAPLVFVNGADTKAAQMFTLAHELVHIWAGKSALSDATLAARSSNATERWCNQVAAELLVPLAVIRSEFVPVADLGSELNRLAKRFKVSTLVVLRRIYDAGGISQEAFQDAYKQELSLLQNIMDKKSGQPSFYLTAALRVSHRFAKALMTSTLEGKTQYRDAFRMLGVKKLSTFEGLGRSLRVS
jgi:Zn-dependent peptidase ImmA (M78 family)